MATQFRIATFNVENLFQRPKLLNLYNTDVTSQKLDAFSNLEKELRKTTYDKTRILDLYRSLKAYIRINEQRGRLFNRRKDRVLADGKSDWDGFVELKLDRFGDATKPLAEI